MLAPGDDAPRFELPDQHGDTVELPEEGAAVVYFYPRADTPGCTTEACGFRDAWDAFEERAVPVFGISDDSVDDLADFAEKYDLPFRLLSDADGSVARQYDSYGEKRVGGKTFEGAFRNTFVVRDGDVVAVFEGVSPAGHAEEVLAALDGGGTSA
ncbi:peroxiredoxin [Halomarina litorea]|uniref:peroxiredoxin n=1 Tax=Halomarina litorea TaxID=2961595 RepID=UPI0020C2B0B6|nr:peroxiredoxin [Halomarina sp. BCD28]